MSDTDRLDWLADNLAYIMLGADYTKGRTMMEVLPNNGRGWKDGELRAAIDKARGVQPKDLNTLVAEKLRSEHVITSTPGDSLVAFSCSCGATWNLGINRGAPNSEQIISDQIKESFKSHHISVGLRPSEVL